MSEVIGEVFSPETMTKITGIQVTPEMLDVLRDDDSYQIAGETDSTVIADDAAAKQAVSEYLNAVGQFMQLALAGGIPQEVAQKLLLWASRRFKVSREVEALLETPLPPGGGDKEPNKASMDMMKEQTKAETAKAKLQLDYAKLDSNQRIKVAELDLKQRELDQEREAMLLKAQADLGA